MARWMGGSRASVAAAMACAAVWSWPRVACAAEVESRSRPAVADRVKDEADRLLAETRSAAEAARRWLAEHASRERIEEAASEARARAARAWQAAMDEAKRTYERSLGLRVFQPPQTPGAPGRWTPLADGEMLPSRLVVLIHGLDEPGDVWEDAAPELARAGHAVARFDYPNDQAIARSAERFLGALRALRTARGVERAAIIGHSMGGLVARDALTRAGAYAGRASAGPEYPEVERVVLIAVPNRGSPMAPLRLVAEAREQLSRFLASGGRSPETLLGFTADGAGEAGRDLAPGSAYLDELNARPGFSAELAARTTNIIAEFRPLSREEVTGAADSALARDVLAEADRAALRDAALGLMLRLGDGIVPDDSAAMAGIEDEVRVPAHHRSVVRRVPVQTALLSFLGQPMGEPPAIAVILDRLSERPTGFGRTRAGD